MAFDSSPDDDPRLVARAQHGDAAAYSALVERYQDVAFRVAYLVTGSSADAEDVAQDAFLKAYFALPRFHAGAPFRPWLLQIVANEARNRRRAAGRRASLTLRAAQSADATGVDSPEASLLADEQRRRLLESVNALRDDDRLAIAYRYFLDLSEAEMASALGCARGTVKSRLSRALDRLRAHLNVQEAGSRG